MSVGLLGLAEPARAGMAASPSASRAALSTVASPAQHGVDGEVLVERGVERQPGDRRAAVAGRIGPALERHDGDDGLLEAGQRGGVLGDDPVAQLHGASVAHGRRYRNGADVPIGVA